MCNLIEITDIYGIRTILLIESRRLFCIEWSVLVCAVVHQKWARIVCFVQDIVLEDFSSFQVIVSLEITILPGLYSLFLSLIKICQDCSWQI